ncbi:FAD-binding oxidoreductase [Streptomyces sp. NBC_00249]|uniref:NAD(P)/FAD-dependent oxidoreductase n=1 Tax=Streptomyces sp. NBC_00249 TaxID=2975690 RepID=UPI00225AAFA3|nr:FAD-binding oxidoreductase [Streptomyces sp. NBC_00249]MCX5193509.1 FAD-binding oxidoreductase [Streptomyces sp. NBC_00249]
MRIAVIGGGIAGAMLAHRLHQLAGRADLTVFAGPVGHPADATSASGGMVRGFETAAEECRLAAESLAELRGSAWFRQAGDYREIGSVYLLRPGEDPTALLAHVELLLPGSAEVEPAEAVARRLGLRGLPAGALAVVERRAGYMSPALLRSCVLDQLTATGVRITDAEVLQVTARAGVLLADGGSAAFDLVVVAAGAWTPALLPGVDGLRTKRIQYGVYGLEVPGLGIFADENSGLYGRPHGAGALLLGQATEDWDVIPGQVRPAPQLATRATAAARRFLPAAQHLRAPQRLCASFDCYPASGGLRLRAVPDSPQVFTFTGGSGGAAKTALAASRRAAQRLLGLSPD